MIRSFKDKTKAKREAYQAEQDRLAVIAEQKRKEQEWELFEQQQADQRARNQQILAEEESRQHAEYLRWKQEQQLLKEQQEQQPAEKINTGVGMGHESTWRLSWQSFSTHPDIVHLPMSEKVRLFKIAERQQIDRLNYYANLHSDYWQGNQVIAGTEYWEDGIVDQSDIADDPTISIISEDITWTNSVDINTAITVQAGVTLTVQGILTTNALITNFGTIIVKGLIVENVSINNQGAGQVIVG